MHGQRVGYIRVSSFDQNPERQLENVSVDRAFTDKASGKDTQRPELENLLAFVREGDTLVVHSMYRLARNLDDLRRLESLEQSNSLIRLREQDGVLVLSITPESSLEDVVKLDRERRDSKLLEQTGL